MNVLKGCRFTVVSCIAVNGVTVIENPQPKADQDQAVGEFVLNQRMLHAGTHHLNSVFSLSALHLFADWPVPV